MPVRKRTWSSGGKRREAWQIDVSVNGRRVRQTLDAARPRAEARAIERALVEQLERADLDARLGRTPDRPFGDLMIRWLREGAPASLFSHLRNVRPYVESVPLSGIVEAAAGMKARMLADGLSHATINRRLACIRRMLQLAYAEWGWLDQPLAQKVGLLSERGSARHVYLSAEDVSAVAAGIRNPRYRAAVILLAFTGLRVGELVGLRPENFRDGRIILDAATKGKRPRVIPVPEDLHPSLASLPLDIRHRWLDKLFKREASRLGHPEWRLHDLRHTYASWLVANPAVPLTVVRDLLGHSSLSVTSRYSHLRTDALDAAIRHLPKSGTNPAQDDDTSDNPSRDEAQ